MNIVFSEEDLRLFSEASRDRNPLHLSTPYARTTSFGQPVVFGALGVLACLSEIGAEELPRVQRLTADFHRPMFVGVSYSASKSKQNDTSVIRLFDGSVNVLTVAVAIGNVHGVPLEPTFDGEISGLVDSARLHSWESIQTAQAIEGVYQVEVNAARRLSDRFSISSIAADTLKAVLWSSYLIGMELPGERALFFRCVFTFSEARAVLEGDEAITFHARVRSLNPSIHQVRIAGELTAKSRPLCSTELVAFFRPEVKGLELGEDVLVARETVKGPRRVALVLGASRGLGASIAALLAQSGVEVIAGSRSQISWQSELNLVDAKLLQAEVVDASDVDQLSELRERIFVQHERLDFLVCNAFPAIPSLRLEANAFSRLHCYIAESVDLTLAPLCVFLDLLHRSAGTLVVISSSAVEVPVREWPHYVASKAATEALASVAAQQYEAIRVLVFRPERMLTEMTNTPLGRANAESPGRVAQAIVRRMLAKRENQSFEVVSLSSAECEIPLPVGDVVRP